MAGRKPRNKMRYHAQRCIDLCDDIMLHLQTIDQLSEGYSESVNDHMMSFIDMLENMKKTFDWFRDTL